MAMLAGLAGGAAAGGAAGGAGSGILGSILGGMLGGGGGGGAVGGEMHGPSMGQSAYAANQQGQGFNWGGFSDFMVGAGKGALHGIGEGLESYIRSETQPRPGVSFPGGGYHGGPTGPYSPASDQGILALISSGRRGGGMRLG